MFKRLFDTYGKLKEESTTPRLKFGAKLENSAYRNGRLHPALETLLYYLYTCGEVDEFEMISPSAREKQIAREITQSIKNGHFSFLDAELCTTNVVLTVLLNYLISLQKKPLAFIIMEEWQKYAEVLPSICENPKVKRQKIAEAVSMARQFMRMAKDAHNAFLKILLITLHKVAKRSGNLVTSSLRLAEFLALELMLKKPQRNVSELMRLDLLLVFRFLVIQAPCIFFADVLEFQDVIPIYNMAEMSSSEAVEAEENSFIDL